MKPGSFRYLRPTDLAEALRMLAEYGEDATILAGGQSLMPLLNMRLARPATVIDINRLPGLAGVTVRDDRLDVGALTRAADVEDDAAVRQTLPVLADAVAQIGHRQIRNRTTIGGNLAHADPSSELPAVLACMDGSLELTSHAGTRIVSWMDFFLTVFTTSRRADELVTAVQFPRPGGWRFQFSEATRRRGDFPLVAIAVGTNAVDGEIAGLRIAASGVADRPVRLAAAEQAAHGRRVDPSLINEIADTAAAACNPQSDSAGSSEYRRHLVATQVRRTLRAQFPTALRPAS
jgi:carbon-monoxide dehydrogenase medium subunit